MSKKNPRTSTAGITKAIVVWGAVFALTLFRISVATGGSLGESEALVSVCAAHPDGGYVEGPPGTPLLLSLFHLVGLGSLVPIRIISPIAALILSWAVWWMGRRLAPHRPAVALWSVLAVNLLLPVTIASLVMNGAMVSATLILLSVVSGWSAARSHDGNTFRSWALFGLALAVTTFFFQPVGFLLPVALAFRFVNQGVKQFPWRGVMVALCLLILGWIIPLSWNARHDWIQWSSVAHGFDIIEFGNVSVSLGLAVALCGLVTPPLVLLAFARPLWRIPMIFLLILLAMGSGIFLLVSGAIPEGLPSPSGVSGIAEMASDITTLRDNRVDAKGAKPILIASTPGLAALLGSRINLSYPERPGSPSVFALESPSCNSSFSLWPGYADAVGEGIQDSLYTEEKWTSPFLGRNALYITTESREELPQTLTGAFDSVGLLREFTIRRNGRPVTARVYQCENYRTLSL